ncbi:hypothetical protein [Butyrivibrio sp. NC3005]|uniref:hypothetical protein n=1 Tax=Butyrivibrio sp. NC3005 TaxID=1280685 RepID=UPI00041C035E|nr:hypothetical protein [Butyrivibrio sp. NC3005]
MKKAIVFGKGNLYQKNKNKIKKTYRIIAFLDNAVDDVVYDSNEDCYIINPRKLEDIIGKEEKCSLLIVSQYYIEMFNQIKSLYDNKFESIEILSEDEVFIQNNELFFRLNSRMFETFENRNQLMELKRRKMMSDFGVEFFINAKIHPVSSDGSDFGMPIDRYYIEKFIEKNKESIKGNVLEVQDDRYSRKYGDEKNTNITICHVEGWNNAKLINFETGIGVEEDVYDCIICTQTLQYIYDVKKSVENIVVMLKQCGCALITLPGIKPISDFHQKNWGEYWSFTNP